MFFSFNQRKIAEAMKIICATYGKGILSEILCRKSFKDLYNINMVILNWSILRAVITNEFGLFESVDAEKLDSIKNKNITHY